MEKWVAEFNQFLTQAHLRALTLGIECICTSIKADNIESSSLVSPKILSLEYLRGRCRDIRSLLRDICIAHTRIEAAASYTHILTPHSTQALRSKLRAATANSLSRSPALLQIEGNWKDGTMDGSSHSIIKSNKEALAKQPAIKIEIFGGASLFDLSDDEDDDEPFVPPPVSSDGESLGHNGGEETKKKCPEPRIPRGFSLIQDPRSMNIWLFDSLELARQFTVIDHALFCAIPLSCFVTSKPMWSLPRYHRAVPEIRAFIDRFNATSLWATTAVLEGETPSERAYVFSQLVELARHLHKLHNYHSLMAIFTGLQQGAISRLQDTLACVSASDKEKFTKLQQIMSAQKNYQAYRETIQQYGLLYPQSSSSSSTSSSVSFSSFSSHGGPYNPMEAIVPHLGCHLSELATISEGNPDHLITHPHLLNIIKRRLLKKSVRVLANAQGLHYNYRPIRLIGCVINRTLRDWLRLGASTSQQEAKNLFEISLIREPDNKPVTKGLRAMMGRHNDDELGEIVVNDDVVGGDEDSVNGSKNGMKKNGKSPASKNKATTEVTGVDMHSEGASDDEYHSDDDENDKPKISRWKVLKAMLTPTKKKHGGIRSSVVLSTK